MTFITLHDIVKVRGRFHRSVQLARDWADRRNLSEYLLMSTTRDLASRILQNIQAPQGVKAWSITGPYGTGKSAFALFLTDLLSQDLPDHPQAKVLRCELKFQMPPILPVLMVGERAPLIPAFLSTLAASILPIAPSLAETVKRASQTPRISDSDMVALVTQSAQVAKQAGYGGLLIVMDEFGKFLEYLSLHPEDDDLLVMQHLAEAVTRSPIPIALITILHTSFAEYLPQTNEAQRMEWQKVQGRFADVAFQEPPGQLLKLIGAAIQRQMPSEIEIAYLETVSKVVSSSALSEAHRRFPLEELLSDCVPLHPITALLLWPIFRGKLAQNERSLFAFLTGMEPFGFQEFLSLTVWSGRQPPFYRVDQLYDYVITVLGPMTYTGDRAHRWAEIDHAICRIPADGPPLSQAIVKVVGLVGLYGAAIGLKASEEIISTALGSSEDVSTALSYLEHSSILIFRRFEGAYGLWEGSDIDVDKCFEEARRHVGQGNISVRLKGVTQLRPLVARAHHIKTGTLRYFSVDIIDGTEQNLRQAFESAARSADGQVIYVLTSHFEDRRSLIELARMLTDEGFAKSNLNILAFPKPIAGLEEALFEVEAWRWVMENVQALQGDVVGRREVKVRLLQAEKRLEGTVGRIFGLGGERFDPAASEWVQGGNIHNPQSAKGFSRWLSDLCDAIFNQSPNLHNELINRDRLSSAAAKARRNLLEAMLTREREPDLGFKGTPAEVSMYRTLLSASGFHRFRDGQLGFGEPGGEWSFVWHEIHQFLKTTRTARRSIKDLFSILKRPPLGFRDGPLPILLCVVLLAYQDRVGLYEAGMFVPELRIEVLERLLRMPELFEIQEYIFTKRDKEALVAVGDILRALQLSEDHFLVSELLSVIKPLVTFAGHLPFYTKHTRKIDPQQALAVRDVLLKAKDPYTLLFSELPEALGIPPAQQTDTTVFKQLLEHCLQGLQRAYPRLLDELEIQVRDTFNLYGTSEEAKNQLQSRASLLNGHVAERTLALFVREASRFDHRDWREVIARAVKGGIPLHQWHDADVLNFQIQLRQIARDFTKLEELLIESQHANSPQILHIGLLNGHLQEDRAVIAIPLEHVSTIESLSKRIFALLEEEGQNEEWRRIRLAAIAQVAAKYLNHDGRTEDE